MTRGRRLPSGHGTVEVERRRCRCGRVSSLRHTTQRALRRMQKRLTNHHMRDLAHVNRNLPPFFVGLRRRGRSRPPTSHARGEAESTEGRQDGVEALRWGRSDEHPDRVALSTDGEVEAPEADGRSVGAFDTGASIGPHSHA
jgi:hypothetical protein